MIKVINKSGIAYIIPEHKLKEYINKGFKEVKEVKPEVKKAKKEEK